MALHDYERTGARLTNFRAIVSPGRLMQADHGRPSFWNWAAHPMRVVGALWIALYAFDNAVRIGSMLGIARWLPLIMMEQFDRGMYTCRRDNRHHDDRSLVSRDSRVARKRQRRVAEACPNRLVTVSLAITTVVCTAIVFWATPEIIARVRRHRWPDIRFGSKGSHLQLPRRVNARSHAPVHSAQGKSLPHGRRRTIPWHEQNRASVDTSSKISDGTPQHSSQKIPDRLLCQMDSSLVPTSSIFRAKPPASW